MSTRFIKVGSSVEAWSVARSIVFSVVAGMDYPTEGGLPGFIKDEESSSRAGYSVYRLDAWRAAHPGWRERLYYNYVSDLGDCLELNTCGADWSGDVYRIVIDPSLAANTAEGSEVGAADSVQGSEVVTLRLRRRDVCQISMALLGVKWDHINEARSLPVDDPRRGVCIRSARMWDDLRAEVRGQLLEHDALQGRRVDAWEVVA